QPSSRAPRVSSFGWPIHRELRLPLRQPCAGCSAAAPVAGLFALLWRHAPAAPGSFLRRLENRSSPLCSRCEAAQTAARFLRRDRPISLAYSAPAQSLSVMITTSRRRKYLL